MNQKIKILKRIALFLCIMVLSANCTNDENLERQDGNSSAKLKETQKWFSKYESEGENYFLLDSLHYKWDEARITNSEDGTETTIVPIVEKKKDNREFWEQRLYIYKTGEKDYKALVYEIVTNKYVPLSKHSLDGGDFTGFISVWDLKTGFVRAARFENNQIIETGVVEVIDYTKRNATNKAPVEAPCVYADFGDGGCGGKSNGGTETTFNGGALREVPVSAPSKGSPVEYYGPRSPVIGGGNAGGYTSPSGGGASSGGSSSTEVVPPSCECFNFITKKGANWQEALVINVNFRIVLLTPPNHIQITQVISFPQAISFGMPVNFNKGNGDVTAGVAATVSARVLQLAMDETVARFGKTEVSEMTVRLYFQEQLINEYRKYTNGGIVNFNSTSNIPATQYKTNPTSSGNCD
ncbi:hypothetical protein [Flavobacterium sp. ASV13]|uniref:hypothetical protein n=1 Tax=Flavobacterium sp. ASV13 TaxID=1506583 RepID=UPI0005576EB1|nr:hypothetical protein [Flavobacterium sp. ASV13]